MAQSGTDDIVQNVVLAGQAEVIEAFLAIAAAGTLAFQGIRTAAESQSFTGIATALGEISGALAIVTAGVFEWSRASSEAVAVQARLATAESTTLEYMSSMIGGMQALGATTDGLTAAMKRFAVRVASDWPQIQKDIRENANKILGAQLGVQKSNIDLAEAQVTLQFQSRKAAELQLSDTLRVFGARHNLAQRAYEEDLALGGIRDSQFEIDQRQEEASLRRREAGLALREAQRKRDEDAANAGSKAAEAELNVRLKELEQRKARLRLDEEQAGSVQNLQKFVENAAKGEVDSNLKVQLSQQNIVKGLVAAVASGSSELGKFRDNAAKQEATAAAFGPVLHQLDSFTGTIGEFGLKAPQMFPLLLKMADLFHGLTDETTKQAVAVALLGRGFNQSLVESLSEGSVVLQATAKRLEELGFRFTSIKERGEESDEFIEKQFRRSLGLLRTEVSTTGTQLGLLFDPLWTAVLQGLSGALEQNHAAILAWGQGIKESVTPPVVALIELLSGAPVKIKLTPEQVVSVDQWKITFTNIYNTITEWGGKVKTFFDSTLPTVANTILGILNGIAAALNFVFRTDFFTGAGVGIGLLIGQFTGLNNVVLALLPTFATLLVGAGLALGATGLLGLILAIPAAILGWKLAEFALPKVIELVEAIKAKFSELPPFLQSIGEKVGRAVLDGLERAVPGIRTILALIEKVRAAGEAPKPKQTPEGEVDLSPFEKSGTQGSSGFQRSFTPGATESAGVLSNLRSQSNQVADIAAQYKSLRQDMENQFKTITQDMRDNVKTALSGLPKPGEGEQELTPVGAPGRPVGPQGPAVPVISPTPTQPSRYLDESKYANLDEYNDAINARLKQQAQQAQQAGGQDQTAAAATTTNKQATDSTSRLGGAFDTLAGQVQALASAISSAIQSIQQATGTQGKAGESQSQEAEASNQKLAGGGSVGGKSGIDQNLSWLTKDEFVQPVAAVKHYGVGMMEAIRTMRLPKMAFGGLFEGLSTYAGSSRGMIPAYASGGLNTGGTEGSRQRGFTLVLDGQPHEVRGDQKVVDALESRAIRERLRSTGTSPRSKR